MSPQAKVLGNKPSPSFRLRNPSLNSLRLRRIFDSFDHNGDGIISPAELSLALDRLGLSSDPTEISLLFPVNSAGLDFDAFSALHRSLGDALFGSVEEKDGLAAEQTTLDQGGGAALAVVDEMAEAFKVFDEDGDGFISAKELQTVLGKLGLKEGESLQRVEDMIGSVDCNHDGRVDFDEFKHMMMRSAVVVVGVN